MREPRRVLFIDDEESLVEVMRVLLAKAGYRVTTSTTAADALSLYTQDPAAFDLVISDINLRGMSGMALSREILRQRPAQLIVLLSGHVSDSDLDLARQAGVRHVLQKPMTFAAILKRIEQVLREPNAELYLGEAGRRQGSGNREG